LLQEWNFEDLLNETANHKKGKRSVKDVLSLTDEKDKFSRTRFNTINGATGTVQLIEKRMEGYLKSRHKYWFVLYDSIPLMCYYNKQDDAMKGKKPKGQIFLGGSEVLTTMLIKTEPYSFIVIQPDGQKFVLCAKTQEELNGWLKAIEKGYPNYAESSQQYMEVIKKQQTMIKNLQKGLKNVLQEKENASISEASRLKRPNDKFYKEFFFFLVLSVNRSEGLRGASSLNHHELYKRAQREKIPFHEWHKWIPQQIKKSMLVDSSEKSQYNSDASNHDGKEGKEKETKEGKLAPLSHAAKAVNDFFQTLPDTQHQTSPPRNFS